MGNPVNISHGSLDSKRAPLENICNHYRLRHVSSFDGDKLNFHNSKWISGWVVVVEVAAAGGGSCGVGGGGDDDDDDDVGDVCCVGSTKTKALLGC